MISAAFDMARPEHAGIYIVGDTKCSLMGKRVRLLVEDDAA